MLKRGSTNNEKQLIHQCKETLGVTYKDYWIEIIYYDTEQIKVRKLYWKLNGHKNKRYNNDNSEYIYYYKRIGIDLYRREHPLDFYLSNKGIKMPEKPKGTVSYIEYQAYKQLWEKYNKDIILIAKESIEQEKKQGMLPIHIEVRAENKKGASCVADLSIKEVAKHIDVK